MTFKQLVKWANDRACDGCWGYLEAVQCIEVIRDVRCHPFWKREDAWQHHHMNATVQKIVLQTNQKIKELTGREV